MVAKNDYIYWAGCAYRLKYPEVAKATEHTLKRAGLKFQTLGEKEGCCGALLFLTGFEDEGRKNALKVIRKISKKGCKSIVTDCAGCYRAFSRLFPSSLNRKVPFNVLHSSQLMDRLIQRKKLKLKELKLRVAYHDPCELGRHCGVYEEPRKVLKAIPGLELVEAELNRAEATCCGGGGGVWALYTDVAQEVTAEKLKNEILPLKVDALVSTCPACYTNFCSNVNRNELPVKVYNLSQMVELALR